MVERAGLFGEIYNVRFEQTMEDSQKKLLFGLEMPENQSLADPRIARNFRHRGLMKPTGREQVRRSLENLVPGIRRP